jgi:hypothetical protein
MIWKSVKGFEGHYEINRNGEIYSIKQGGFIKPFKTNRGYWATKLGKRGKTYCRTLAKWVAIHFLPPQPPNTTLRFKDWDRDNYKASNLVYVPIVRGKKCSKK